MDGVERHSRTEFCLTQWPAEFPELIALRPEGVGFGRRLSSFDGCRKLDKLIK